MEKADYHRKFGWGGNPFIKSTDIDLPIIEQHETYNEVLRSIDAIDRVMVLTAPMGYGKTTFMNLVLKKQPKVVDYLAHFDTYEPVEGVMRRIVSLLPFWKKVFRPRPDRSNFGEYLKKCLGPKKMLLVFDEAQDYDEGLLRWLRTINDRANNAFMIFIGLPGLEDKLASETSFRDRQSVSLNLRPLSIEQLGEVVRRRIQWVGGVGIEPFSEDGLNFFLKYRNPYPPRSMLEDADNIINHCAENDIFKINAHAVESAFGMVKKIKKEEKVEGRLAPYTINDFPASQRTVIKVMLEKEKVTIPDLSEQLGKQQNYVGMLIKRLRGLDKKEQERRLNVRYPVVVELEAGEGRSRYSYTLSDDARRVLGRK